MKTTMKKNTHSTRFRGLEYEELAAEFLRSEGCGILERNFRTRGGEIDVIYLDGQTICFGEVKYRHSKTHGLSCEAVGYKKQLRISRTSDAYRAKENLTEGLSYRFDVIDISGEDDIEWYKNAFQYIPLWP